MGTLKSVLAVAITLLFCGQALADPKPVTVRAGVTSKIYAYAVYNRTICKNSVLVRLSSPRAKNGTLSSRLGSFVAPSGRCKGKRITSTDVYYTPKPGFRGTETVRFRMVYDKYIDEVGPVVAKGFRIKVTVK